MLLLWLWNTRLELTIFPNCKNSLRHQHFLMFSPLNIKLFLNIKVAAAFFCPRQQGTMPVLWHCHTECPDPTGTQRSNTELFNNPKDPWCLKRGRFARIFLQNSEQGWCKLGLVVHAGLLLRRDGASVRPGQAALQIAPAWGRGRGRERQRGERHRLL